MKIQVSFSSLISSAILLFISSLTLHAIYVEPNYYFIELKPGGKSTCSINVKNDEDVPITLLVSSKDWFVHPKNDGITSSQWINIKTKTIKLKPGQQKKITYLVTVPPQATGELVGMISLARHMEGVTQVVSAATYIGVTGTEEFKGEFANFEVEHSSGGAVIKFNLFNAGNVHMRPQGQAVLSNSSGYKLFDSGMASDIRVIYPGRQEPIELALDKPLPPDVYTYRVSMTDVDRKMEIFNKTIRFQVDKNGSVTSLPEAAPQ